MIVFIDESGIHKIVGHSTIVLVYICITNLEHLEKSIENIEKKLSIQKFHWADFGSKSGWLIREQFIKDVARLKFNLKIALIKNPFNFPVIFEHCLKHLIIEKKIKKIIIDGRKPKWYERRLKKILRDKGVSVKKLRTLNDEASAGLRLADALAGLIRSYYNKPTEKVQNLYKLIGNKITAQLLSGQRTR